jgi:hypothetical protein
MASLAGSCSVITAPAGAASTNNIRAARIQQCTKVPYRRARRPTFQLLNDEARPTNLRMRFERLYSDPDSKRSSNTFCPHRWAVHGRSRPWLPARRTLGLPRQGQATAAPGSTE